MSSKYESQYITVFPASNSVHKGKIFTEDNIKNITKNIVSHNYVISGYDIRKFDDKSLWIDPGNVVINGFNIVTNDYRYFNYPNSSNIVNDSSSEYNGYALLCLQLKYDSLSNLQGDSKTGDEFDGVEIVYADYEDYKANKSIKYLLLCCVDLSGNIKEVNNKIRFDSSDVEVNLQPDNKTKLPPKQQVSLNEFTTNYLPSYWLGKGGDYYYGNLVLTSKPDGYDLAGFQHETENKAVTNPRIDKDKNVYYSIKLGQNLSSTKEVQGNFSVRYINGPSATSRRNYNINETFILPGIFTFRDNTRVDSYEDIQTDYHTLFTYNDENKTIGPQIKGYTNTTLMRTYPLSLSTDQSGDILSDNRSTEINDICNFVWDRHNNTSFLRSVEQEKKYQRFKVQLYKDSSNIENHVYVGALDCCLSNGDYVSDTSSPYYSTQNDLISTTGSIRTAFKHAEFNEKNSYIDIRCCNVTPSIEFCFNKDNKVDSQLKGKQVASISIDRKDNTSILFNSDWNNILNISDNLYVKSNIKADGYITAGTGNPTDIKVPDVANGFANRKLKSGDIYATQVWSAVYNDYAEIFDLIENLTHEDVRYLVIAQSKNDKTKYTIASRVNTNIIGVVSENPGICTGGADCKNGVPVALSGRVKVKYTGKLKIGDYVGLSKKKAGYVSKCYHFSKYCCGKVLNILDKDLIEILIK